ncbi:MAG: hypothetical protein ACTTHL_08410 [Oribacterium sp.]
MENKKELVFKALRNEPAERLLAENRRIYGDGIAMFYNVFAPLCHGNNGKK